MPLIILLALFIGLPVIEIATFIKVGAKVGAFNTIAFIFLTAFLGVILVRWQGFQALAELRRAMDEGRPPMLEIASGALLLLAGVLLLIPGFVTDAAGFLLLVPPLRRLLARRLIAGMEMRAEVHVRQGPGGAVIDAEVVEIEDDPKALGHDGSPWNRK